MGGMALSCAARTHRLLASQQTTVARWWSCFEKTLLVAYGDYLSPHPHETRRGLPHPEALLALLARWRVTSGPWRECD